MRRFLPIAKARGFPRRKFDELNKRFAKRQVKKLVSRFEPSRWREAWEDSKAKNTYQRLVASIRAQAQRQLQKQAQ